MNPSNLLYTCESSNILAEQSYCFILKEYGVRVSKQCEATHNRT